MQKIVVLGGVAFNTLIYVENLPQPVPQTVFSQRFHETVGSTGAGKALNLHPLGLDVLLHGLVGDDENGRKLQTYLSNHNIPFISDNDPGGTKHHVNLMDNFGQRISIHVVPGTFEPDINWTAIEPYIAEADLVALNIINYCRHAIPIIKKYNKPIWCDIHDYDGTSEYHQAFIDAADVIFMSSDALPAFRPCSPPSPRSTRSPPIASHALPRSPTPAGLPSPASPGSTSLLFS